MPIRLIVATGNTGKLREVRSLLAGLPDGCAFEVSSLRELGLPSPAETGSTFVANALLKARHAAAAWADANGGQIACAMADDSGLEVDALNGAPGIYSARYAGVDADDAANNAKLLMDLRGVPPQRRCARYRCAVAFVRCADDSRPLIAEGEWQGFILQAPRGVGGFGYDPYFWVPDLARTAAELEPVEKNALSHRGKALRALIELLTSEPRAIQGSR